jgi:hypothetical protein
VQAALAWSNVAKKVVCCVAKLIIAYCIAVPFFVTMHTL